MTTDYKFSAVEICAGAGGLALGLERAGFQHLAAIDNDANACATLRLNRPKWRVIEADIREVNGDEFAGADLLAGGVPCPPFSIAGRQLGQDDERDLFPEIIRLADEIRPKAILVENVRGFAAKRFAEYRGWLFDSLRTMGFQVAFKVLDASEYGAPQRRLRSFLVALSAEAKGFRWPEPYSSSLTVADVIGDLMAADGWEGAEKWKLRADQLAPTIVGGSKKHGGPDLGPARARKQWEGLGVDGLGIVDRAPGIDSPVSHVPRLTVRMAARIQCFPDDWEFSGKKTASYKQVGNALPPPLAEAVACEINRSLAGKITGFDSYIEQPELFTRKR